jgi:hypothetical protein
MASTYSILTGRKDLSPYQSLQVWRAKQWAFNKTRIEALNTAMNGVFSANMSASRSIGDLAIQAARTRMTASVNKLV